MTLLCSGDRTTTELADELGISANGARWHLERLERDGMVERRRIRRGVGKPADEYRLTDEGSLRISRAYLPFLSTMIEVLRDRHGTAEEEALLRDVGQRLARAHGAPIGGVRERAAAAARLLSELGGSAAVREEDGALAIVGSCCPLRALVPDHPLACRAVESMLEEYIGVAVRERCDRERSPGCRFTIGDPPG